MEPVIDHRPFIRERENAHTAVLMLHGIAGSPAHFRDLLPVIPDTVSVYNILLSGHGGSVRDFSRTSMKTWKKQSEDMVNSLLHRYENLYIVAHSMGTLFAIRAAVDHPGKIRGLFLLAVPLRPWVRLSTWLNALSAAMGTENEKTRILKNDCSIHLTKNLFAYIGWIPRFWELLQEIRRTRKLLPRLTVPTATFQSQKDELVSARSIRDLTGYPFIHNTVLYGSGHFCYSEKDTNLLRSCLESMLNGGAK